MRMIPTLAAVIAIGLSLIVLGGLGVEFGTDIGEQNQDLQDEISDEQGENRSLEPDEGQDGGFFSFAVGALNEMRSMVSVLVFFPSTLRSFGMPGPAATALGYGTQFIIAIGLIQVALRWSIQ